MIILLGVRVVGEKKYNEEKKNSAARGRRRERSGGRRSAPAGSVLLRVRHSAPFQHLVLSAS